MVMSSFFGMYSHELELLGRILLSSICGGLIGYERTKRLKEAGIRTHCVVAFGAALMMIISKYGFCDLVTPDGIFLYGSRGADSARIAAQVVSGIGFLGAGVIFRNGVSVQGLTTAAGLWATSAVGLALGAGMYLLGGAATVMIIAEQYLMHRLRIGQDAYSRQEISLQFLDTDKARKKLFEFLEERGSVISSCSGRKMKNGDIKYQLVIRTKNLIMAEELQEMMNENKEIHAFSV